MKKAWIILITLMVSLVFILILVLIDAFSGATFFGMMFYVALFLGGYFFIMVGKNREARILEEQANVKQKFDWCWNRVNTILRRMAGGQGLEWASGEGRKSEYRNFHDGITNRGYRSMLGFLSKTQQLVLVIYDIDRDDIVRFQADPTPDMLENHYKNFKPFSRGIGVGDDYDMDPRVPYGGLYSRRGSRAPISINVGEPGGDRLTREGMTSPRPDDDMIDSAVKKVKDNG